MSRDAMNVEGLSEATIEKLIGKGIVKELADLFSLQNYKDVIVEMEGFGNKSFENMVASIERARTVSMPQFIYSLGISNIGLSNAKLICKAYENDLDRMINAKIEELIEIDGIGQVIAETFCAYMSKEKNIKIINNLRMNPAGLSSELTTALDVIYEGSYTAYQFETFADSLLAIAIPKNPSDISFLKATEDQFLKMLLLDTLFTFFTNMRNLLSFCFNSMVFGLTEIFSRILEKRSLR